MKNHYEQIIAGESQLRGPESETKLLIIKGSVNTRVSISQISRGMHVRSDWGSGFPARNSSVAKPALQSFVSKRPFEQKLFCISCKHVVRIYLEKNVFEYYEPSQTSEVQLPFR